MIRAFAPASSSLLATHSAHSRKPVPLSSLAEIEGIRRNSSSSLRKSSFNPFTRSLESTSRPFLSVFREGSIFGLSRHSRRGPPRLVLIYLGRGVLLEKRPDHSPEPRREDRKPDEFFGLDVDSMSPRAQV